MPAKLYDRLKAAHDALGVLSANDLDPSNPEKMVRELVLLYGQLGKRTETEEAERCEDAAFLARRQVEASKARDALDAATVNYRVAVNALTMAETDPRGERSAEERGERSAEDLAALFG